MKPQLGMRVVFHDDVRGVDVAGMVTNTYDNDTADLTLWLPRAATPEFRDAVPQGTTLGTWSYVEGP